MKITVTAFIACLLCSLNSSAQIPSIWREADAAIVHNAGRYSTPELFRTVELDITTLRQWLNTVPKEYSEAGLRTPSILSVPMPDGSMADFEILETAVMAPGLGAKYPGIKTYVAKGISDPHAYARFDVTNFGFHGMIISPRGDVLVDPVSHASDRFYISYFKKDVQRLHSFECLVDETDDVFDRTPVKKNKYQLRSNGEELRTYRLALACTGEYAAEYGGTVSGALSGMVTSINRVTGLYEQELSIRLQLIENDTLLIFLNSATDGYSNFSGFTMLDQNQDIVDDIIGNDNYDIGHVFSTGGGGIATRPSVCLDDVKAQGVTGLPSPVGDAFDIDYVAHEMGHQFSANHTFNSITGGCNGNRFAGTAFEPGSGSTIMGYAGLCNENNLQTHSDAFFHSGTFDEIIDYTTEEEGNNCPVITSTGNTPPVVTVGSDFSIPISTPFRLDASATDANGESLLYLWEQLDKGASCDWNEITGNAPCFRSFKADTNTFRYFPKLSTVVANYPASVKGEILPDYARSMKFRFTARDMHLGGGGVSYNDDYVTLTVVNTTVPFEVIFPNGFLTWAINTPWEVTWEVATTNLLPINCQKVNILLSTDGGFTYPITLASGVPNTGIATVTMPNDASLVGQTDARIMVQSVGNVFYDISNANFTITGNVGIADVDISSDVSVYPNPVTNITNVFISGLNQENISLKVYDVIGKVIYEEHLSGLTGEKTISLDLSEVSSGTFLVEVITEHGKSVKKIMKD